MRAPLRGDLFYVNLEPVVGSEQGGTRPCLIVQNDIGNLTSPVVIVAVLTARHLTMLHPTDVLVQPGASGLTTPSRVLLNQLRPIDKPRLGRRIGRIRDEELLAVDEALRISLGLVPL